MSLENIGGNVVDGELTEGTGPEADKKRLHVHINDYGRLGIGSYDTEGHFSADDPDREIVEQKGMRFGEASAVYQVFKDPKNNRYWIGIRTSFKNNSFELTTTHMLARPDLSVFDDIIATLSFREDLLQEKHNPQKVLLSWWSMATPNKSIRNEDSLKFFIVPQITDEQGNFTGLKTSDVDGKQVFITVNDIPNSDISNAGGWNITLDVKRIYNAVFKAAGGTDFFVHLSTGLSGDSKKAVYFFPGAWTTDKFQGIDIEQEAAIISNQT
jgi:hypothetical protein